MNPSGEHPESASQGGERTIAVTGGGSGLGAAIARRFGRAGYRVAVIDIDAARASEILALIEAQGGEGFAFEMDVNNPSDWAALDHRVMTEWGGLEVLVNNAGVAAWGRLEESTLDDWQWVLDTDLFSVVRGCHQFLPQMRKQRRGHVVNMASFAGMIAVPQGSAYATAKAGVVALSNQLRVDLAGSGVGISVVCPAFVRTRLLDSFRSRDEGVARQVKRWMEHSGVTADDVAERVFKAVQSGRFLVLTHFDTRLWWRIVRWFPNLTHRLLVRMAGKRKFGGRS